MCRREFPGAFGSGTASPLRSRRPLDYAVGAGTGQRPATFRQHGIHRTQVTPTGPLVVNGSVCSEEAPGLGPAPPFRTVAAGSGRGPTDPAPCSRLPALRKHLSARFLRVTGWVQRAQRRKRLLECTLTTDSNAHVRPAGIRCVGAVETSARHRRTRPGRVDSSLVVRCTIVWALADSIELASAAPSGWVIGQTPTRQDARLRAGRAPGACLAAVRGSFGATCDQRWATSGCGKRSVSDEPARFRRVGTAAGDDFQWALFMKPCSLSAC